MSVGDLSLACAFGLVDVLVGSGVEREPMMAYMFGQGLVMPNATAAAMAPHGQSAGVISSLMGVLQTAGGALAGYLVGAFYDHTPLSLAVTVGAFAALTLLASGHVRLPFAGTADKGGEALHVTCGA